MNRVTMTEGKGDRRNWILKEGIERWLDIRWGNSNYSYLENVNKFCKICETLSYQAELVPSCIIHMLSPWSWLLACVIGAGIEIF